MAFAVNSMTMAIGATMHTFEIQLADVDRGVYEDLSLRVAQHPSETDAYLVTRVLAYCLEYEEGIAFSAGGAFATRPAITMFANPVERPMARPRKCRTISV